MLYHHSLRLYQPYIIAALFMGTVSITAAADDIPQESWEITIGALGLSIEPAWRGLTRQNTAIPYLSASKGNWQLGGGDSLIRYHFRSDLGFFAGLGYQDDGYGGLLMGNSDNAHEVFDDYDTPDGQAVVELGLEFGWFSLTTAHSIFSSVDTFTVEAELSVPVWQIEDKLSISLDLTMQSTNANYAQHFFGVSREQADPSVGRTVYLIDNSDNWSIGLSAIYRFNRHWGVLGEYSRQHFDDKIAASPLMDQEEQDIFILGLLYQL
jgi:outer membrane scaffolding protein for murein synthesis (MipA/OmpV family)